jgi:hypothetical protein
MSDGIKKINSQGDKSLRKSIRMLTEGRFPKDKRKEKQNKNGKNIR